MLTRTVNSVESLLRFVGSEPDLHEARVRPDKLVGQGRKDTARQTPNRSKSFVASKKVSVSSGSETDISSVGFAGDHLYSNFFLSWLSMNCFKLEFLKSIACIYPSHYVPHID